MHLETGLSGFTAGASALFTELTHQASGPAASRPGGLSVSATCLRRRLGVREGSSVTPGLPLRPTLQSSPVNPPHLQPCPTGALSKSAMSPMCLANKPRGSGCRGHLLVLKPQLRREHLGEAVPDSSSSPPPSSGHPSPLILPNPPSQGLGMWPWSGQLQAPILWRPRLVQGGPDVAKPGRTVSSES